MEKRKPVVERNSFSIPEFCARNGLAVSTFRRLVRLGRGPAISRVSSRMSRISLDAESEWLKGLVSPTENVQREIDAHATQALDAAKKGVLAHHKSGKAEV